jgi:hypothetical protein
MPFILSFSTNAIHIVILSICHSYWHFYQMPFILPFCSNVIYIVMLFKCHSYCHFVQMPFILSFCSNAIHIAVFSNAIHIVMLFKCHLYCHLAQMPCRTSVIQTEVVDPDKFVTSSNSISFSSLKTIFLFCFHHQHKNFFYLSQS